MTTKSKKYMRQQVLEKLRVWHMNHGIDNFPKRLGISTNEKKFREISFRTPGGVSLENASAEDFIVNTQSIYGMGHTLVARVVAYRVWLPSEGRKTPGVITIRFSLFKSIVGLVKVGPYFVAVEHDNFPLQKKIIGVARMFGVSSSNNLNELGTILLEKEFPFFHKHIKNVNVFQLGNTIYQDTTSRREETVFLLIEVDLNKSIKSKDDLSELIDHRNKEMILHHIFTEDELKSILDFQMGSRSEGKVSIIDDFRFRDQYSSWCLASYFRSK